MATTAVSGGAQAVPYALTVNPGDDEDWTTAPYIISPLGNEGGLLIVGNGIAKFAQLTIVTAAAQGDAVTLSTGSGGLFEVTGGTTPTTRSVLTTNGNGAVGVNVLNASQVTLTNSDIVTTGNSGAHGMAVTGGGTATLNNVTIEVRTTAGTAPGTVAHNVGMLVTNGSTIEMSGGSIKTNGGFNAWGVEVQGAGSSVTLTDVAVTTTGSGGSSGIRLNNAQKNASPVLPSDPSGSGSVIMNGGSVTTSGAQGHGVFVEDYGTFKMDGTKIRTSGDQASGVAVESGAKITIKNADIKATGASSYGVSTGASNIEISGSRIETGTAPGILGIGGKNNADGILIHGTGATVTVDDTTIITNGKNSHGIFINGTAPGTGALKVTNSTITVKSADSHGVVINAGKAEISGSTITASGAASGIAPSAVQADKSAAVKLTGNTIKSTASGTRGITATGGSTVDIVGGSVATTGSGTAHALVVSGDASRLTTDGTVVSATSTSANGLLVSGTGAASSNTAILTDTVLTAKAAAINVASGTGDITLKGAATNVTGNGTWLNVATSAVADLKAQTGAQVTGKITTASGGTSNVAIDSNAAWNISGSSTVTSLSFGGGILRYLQAGATDITSPNPITLNTGGMIADTNGFDNQIAQELTGTGGLTKIGNGTLTLEAVNSYTGLTHVQTGTLLVGDLANPTASVAGAGAVDAGAILSGLGSVAGSVTNNGTIAAWNALTGHESDPVSNFTVGGLANNGTIRLAGGTVGNTLTVAGDYAGGGTMVINTYLGGSSSPTDMLIISGGTATGATMVTVLNAGGPGGLTVGDGIKVVDATNGASTAGAHFTLSSRVAAGEYEYTLARGNGDPQSWFLKNVFDDIPLPDTGPGPTPDPDVDPDPSHDTPSSPAQGWALPNYRVEVPIYMTAPALANRFGLAMLGTYHDRNGEDYIQPIAPVYEERGVTGRDGKRRIIRVATDMQPDRYALAGWARLFGGTGSVGYGGKRSLHARLNTFLKNGPSYDYDLAGFQAGFDVYRRENAKGTSDIAGVYVGAGRIDSDVRGVYGGKAGSMAMDGYTFGGYWTRKGASGWYIDAVAQATLFDDVKGRSVKGQSMTTEGWGFTGSLEGGYPVLLAEGFKLEPQAQLIYQHVSLDSSRDAYGSVSYGDTDTLYGRIGARLTKDVALPENRMMTLWLRANLWHTFGEDAKTTFTNTYKTDLGGSWAQFGLGVSGRVAQNVNLFASGDYEMNIGKAKGHGLTGRLGARVVW